MGARCFFDISSLITSVRMFADCQNVAKGKTKMQEIHAWRRGKGNIHVPSFCSVCACVCIPLPWSVITFSGCLLPSSFLRVHRPFPVFTWKYQGGRKVLQLSFLYLMDTFLLQCTEDRRSKDLSIRCVSCLSVENLRHSLQGRLRQEKEWSREHFMTLFAPVSFVLCLVLWLDFLSFLSFFPISTHLPAFSCSCDRHAGDEHCRTRERIETPHWRIEKRRVRCLRDRRKKMPDVPSCLRGLRGFVSFFSREEDRTGNLFLILVISWKQDSSPSIPFTDSLFERESQSSVLQPCDFSSLCCSRGSKEQTCSSLLEEEGGTETGLSFQSIGGRAWQESERFCSRSAFSSSKY